MKRVINRKLYDTDTATHIATSDNGMMVNDFHYYSEALYRTKHGAYFLHIEGGAATIVGRETGSGMRIASERISACSENDAIDWLSDHDCIVELLTYFPGAVQEA